MAMGSNTLKVLSTLNLPSSIGSRLRDRCQVTQVSSRSDLLDQLAGQDVLLCTSFDRVDSQVVETGQSLKAVVTVSAGYNHVDSSLLRERGVRLGNTPGVLTDSVAEVGVALILATLRQTITKANQVSRGDWSSSTNLFTDLGESLVGKTVGFLGLGRIGLALAQRLLPFKINPTVYYCNRTENTEATKLLPQVVRLGLSELAAVSDILVVTASLSEETTHIVDAEFLSRMRSSAYLINISRGGLVDQEALITALTGGQIRGAGLDVCTPEPLPASSPLLGCPNVVIFPHIGSATVAAREGMADMAVSNILALTTESKMPGEVELQ